MWSYPVLSFIVMVIIVINACAGLGSPKPVLELVKDTPIATDAATTRSLDSTSEPLLPSATPTLLADLAISTPTPATLAETSCRPTPAGDLGPEYVWQAPLRSSVGQGHVLTGVIRSSMDCSPIPQAKLEFWLAGPDGQYDDDHRATLFADQAGSYRFESNFPGKYPERPIPHIHLYVSAHGYRGLITEYHPPQGQKEGSLDLVLVPEDPTVKVVASDENQKPLISVTGQIAFHTQRNDNMDIYLLNVEEALQDPASLEPINLTNHLAEDFFPVWSPDGRQIAFTSDRNGNPEIYLMNADGSKPINLTHNSTEDVDHAWSPDGSQIAFASDRDGNWEIYVMNANGSDVKRLTHNLGEDWAPAWSPDGAYIAFSRQADIWLMKPDGSDLINLTRSPAADDMPAWSPDGSRLAFTSSHQDGNWEIYLLDVETALHEPGNLALVKLTNSPAEDTQPVWSPDGTALAFKSSRDGNYELYAVNVDGSGLSRLTDHPAGDGFPTWRPDHPSP